MISHALVVDDSKAARFMLSKLLEKQGLTVTQAVHAEQALEILETTHPDAIFMDHMLPGIDGLEATRRIKAGAHTAHIPVVMFTSKSEDGYLDEAHAAGAFSVLSKPPQGAVVEQLIGAMSAVRAEIAANEDDHGLVMDVAENPAGDVAAANTFMPDPATFNVPEMSGGLDDEPERYEPELSEITSPLDSCEIYDETDFENHPGAGDNLITFGMAHLGDAPHAEEVPVLNDVVTPGLQDCAADTDLLEEVEAIELHAGPEFENVDDLAIASEEEEALIAAFMASADEEVEHADEPHDEDWDADNELTAAIATADGDAPVTSAEDETDTDSEPFDPEAPPAMLHPMFDPEISLRDQAEGSLDDAINTAELRLAGDMLEDDGGDDEAVFRADAEGAACTDLLDDQDAAEAAAEFAAPDSLEALSEALNEVEVETEALRQVDPDQLELGREATCLAELGEIDDFERELEDLERSLGDIKSRVRHAHEGRDAWRPEQIRDLIDQAVSHRIHELGGRSAEDLREINRIVQRVKEVEGHLAGVMLQSGERDERTVKLVRTLVTRAVRHFTDNLHERLAEDVQMAMEDAFQTHYDALRQARDALASAGRQTLPTALAGLALATSVAALAVNFLL